MNIYKLFLSEEQQNEIVEIQKELQKYYQLHSALVSYHKKQKRLKEERGEEPHVIKEATQQRIDGYKAKIDELSKKVWDIKGSVDEEQKEMYKKAYQQQYQTERYIQKTGGYKITEPGMKKRGRPPKFLNQVREMKDKVMIQQGSAHVSETNSPVGEAK